MYSETDNILNSKSSEKFRKRAVALRRVSILLLVFSFLKIILAIVFWRDGTNVSAGQFSLSTLQKSKIQLNYLSIFIASLAVMLFLQAIIGMYTANQIEQSYKEERSPSKLSESRCFLATIVNLFLTLITFSVFVYCTIWFIAFNEGPANWFENHYFNKDQNNLTTKNILSKDFLEENMRVVLGLFGIHCGVVTIILYASIQLMKKILRRIERINSFIHVESFSLVLLAYVLFLVAQFAINFDGENSSSVIKNQMPQLFHFRYLCLSVLITFIAFFSFLSSYYEVAIMISIDSILCFIALGGSIILTVTNIYSSNQMNYLIEGNSDNPKGKCTQVMPQFHEEQLMQQGCVSKYTTQSENIQELKCLKAEITRVWEDNKDILVADQHFTFGCLNTECCQQVTQIIKARFDVLTTMGILLMISLVFFIVNLQYMAKKIGRYQIRYLNHKGDIFALAAISFVSAIFGLTILFFNFESIKAGMPIVDFQKIVPLGKDALLYYNVADKTGAMKTIKTSQKDYKIVDVQAFDPYLSAFSFIDVNRILPSNDAACPGDGTCREDDQVLMQMKLNQDTDVSALKAKSFFQLSFRSNDTKLERDQQYELILKNETLSKGELSLEGGQKQLKNFLKKYLIVKPACLFDNKIILDVTIQYAVQRKYSELHTRTFSIDLTQVKQQTTRQELDHQLLYRFLQFTDSGDLVPIFQQNQSINAGAGDVLLKFSGYPDSGFQFCEFQLQTLTKGSQHQTSFLPELKRHESYKIKVEANYKDFKPIHFELEVKYLQNLEGKIKYVDLGTHIFFKKEQDKSQKQYRFLLSNVLDDGLDDNYSNYNLKLSDGMMQPYYELSDQENYIFIPETDQGLVPRIGENYVTIIQQDAVFLDSTREFFALPGWQTKIEVPLVSQLNDGELAIVLTWNEGVQSLGGITFGQNLDLHIQFQASDEVLCTVDYTMRQCNGVRFTTDRTSTDDFLQTIQAAKFDYLGDFNYLVYASISKFNISSNRTLNLKEMLGNLKIYAPRHDKEVYEASLPFYKEDQDDKFWLAFCIKGGHGINGEGVTVSDPTSISSDKPDVIRDCSLNPVSQPSVGISQPLNIQATQAGQDYVEISWEEPQQNGGFPISHYRVFVQDNDNQFSGFTHETSDQKRYYKLKTPQQMWGKFFTITVQAINSKKKMSLLSDPAIIEIKNLTLSDHQLPITPLKAPAEKQNLTINSLDKNPLQKGNQTLLNNNSKINSSPQHGSPSQKKGGI